MKDLVSIIIPFLNESENIPFLIESLNEFKRQNNHLRIEVIFINDGSTDESVDKLTSNSSIDFNSKLVNLSKNFGSHEALRAGIAKAKGEFICFLYADLQDPLELISRMYEQCKSGNEICWATRIKTENGIFEILFSKLYSYMMKRYAISNYPENGFDIVMFSKKVQIVLTKLEESNSSIFLQILSLGFNQVTIEYHKILRKRGKSKWTLRKKIKLFIDSFVAFSYAPIRLVTITGVLLFLIGLIWAIYLIARKLFVGDLSSGWPALMSILSIGFGITNISLGIIAEYLWRTLDSSRNRPPYIIDDIIELNNE